MERTMKNSLVILLFLLLPLSNINAQTKSDLEKEGFKGRVKSARYEIAELLQLVGQTVQRYKLLKSVIIYDEKGNRIEELRYNSNGSLFERMVFTHDDKGNQTNTIYKADGTVDSKWVYNYDPSGRITKGSWYNADGTLRLKIVKTYDDKGEIIEDAMYNADGSQVQDIVLI